MEKQSIQTVLGPIAPEDLGETLCHEHVICCEPALRYGFGDEKWLPWKRVADLAAALFRQAKEECGVATIIDGTPLDLGRDPELLREVSQRSGVQIIASSGMYHYESLALVGRTPENLAAYFIQECQEGICGGPVKPGILKCATGAAGVTDANRILLDTMSLVQRETGLPLFAHNEHRQKTALEQLRILEKNRVRLDRVVIGHASDSQDIPYLETLLRSGCFLGFDRIFPHACEAQGRIIAELIARGWENKLLLSHDYFAFTDHGDQAHQPKAPEEAHRARGRDFVTVHKLLLPCLLGYGVTPAQCQKLTRENPRALFA